MRISPLWWFVILLAAILLLTAFGPAEKSLGTNVRVVYLHGVWVWTALAGFLAAAVAGLAGLVSRRQALHKWSRALGRTGLFFWVTYLPISMWAMQANWNGLYLAEPRWRIGLIFAIGGPLMQIGLALVENPAWASACNAIYALVLWLALGSTEQVMHPDSPGAPLPAGKGDSSCLLHFPMPEMPGDVFVYFGIRRRQNARARPACNSKRNP